MNRRERRAAAAVYRLCCAAVTLLAAGLCLAGAAQQKADMPAAPAAPFTAREDEQEALVCPSPISEETAADDPCADEEALAESVTESRYAEVTGEECELMAKIVWLEARGEPLEGQQAVAEVILNRVAAENFPNSVEEVIFEGQDGRGAVQFVTAAYLDTAEPTAQQYAAVGQALYGTAVLPMDVVYFSTGGENDRVWGKLGGHVFCYQYEW